MGHGEVHGEGPEAAVAGQAERRVLVEDLSVQVHANVGLHVLGAVVQHLEPLCMYDDNSQVINYSTIPNRRARSPIFYFMKIGDFLDFY